MTGIDFASPAIATYFLFDIELMTIQEFIDISVIDCPIAQCLVKQGIEEITHYIACRPCRH
jgi:hypothetical protein